MDKISQEGTRGGLVGFYLLAPLRNLTMRTCFPRDQPSTASYCTVIVATCTFSLRSNLSCQRKHYFNRASSAVFSARRTPVNSEQTPLQCIGLPRRGSSSLSDGVYPGTGWSLREMVKGLRGLARKRSSYCDLQITQSTSFCWNQRNREG